MSIKTLLLKTRPLCFLSFFLLISCSYFSSHSLIQNRSKQYLTAKDSRPLRLAPGMSPQAFRSYYPIPSHQYPEAEKSVSLLPPGLMENS